VSSPSPSADPEIQAEQAYLSAALSNLAAMRQRATTLLKDLVGAGNPDLDYQAALVRRVSLLADSPRPLLFGRIDHEDGQTWHIGRRHVEDQHSDPVVVDWRAPISVPFYRARAGTALGLSRRRQIMVDRDVVLSVADDLFGGIQGDGTSTRIRGGDALLAELERSRTGEMLDIVATIQAEQDEIIRAPLGETLAVQGGPGTGKTAVGLHRAAFLIYNHPSLSHEGVLVLGPSRAFLRYIAQVLPSLGEEAVVQTTIADIAPKAKVRGTDPMVVRHLKGDARMGQVLARALDGRRRRITEDVSVRVGFARCTISAARANQLVDGIVARPAPYKSGRLALKARLVSQVRTTFRDSGRIGADRPSFEKNLVASDEFSALLDTMWPTVSPVALVRDLLGSRSQLSTYAEGILTDDEWPLLLKAKGGSTIAAWTLDDLPLLDEASFLISGRTRSYGHVVIDEAQDLTPMQYRMVARRMPTGSMTILGDLAQATGPWTYNSWDEILEHLPSRAPTRRDELTLGYRAPGRVLDFASRLLPAAAPTVQPTTSIREGRFDPRIVEVTHEELAAQTIAEALRVAGDHPLVALIAAIEHVPELAKLAGAHPTIGLLDRDGITRPITILAAPEAKGLEFDAAVVMEPAAIAGTDRRGLRLLYVAMTRPIQHLSLVHADPLPAPLTASS
jgi:DNA helicase IV